MGFLVCTIRPLEADYIAIKPLQSLVIGGPKGLFAKTLPTMTGTDHGWKLTTQAILELAGFKGDGSETILFDLTPGKPEQIDYYELLDVRGRTVSMVTDALFHFKVACSGARAQFTTSESGELIVPNWRHRPDRYEQMRLEGGVLGGTWAWSDPLQAMSATVL